MKVLHVIPSLSAARGGPAFALRLLAAGLAAEGVTVDVAATDDDGPDGHLDVPRGKGIKEGGVLCFYFRRQTRFYSFSWPLTAWLHRHVRDYDLIHIHALFSYPSTVAAWLARRARVPYVIRPLGTLSQWGLKSRRPFLKRFSMAFVERPLLSASCAVHATSQQEREEALAACPECRTFVVPNPVESPAEIRRVPRGSGAIVFLSRIDPKKGLEVLLEAFDRVALRLPQARLVIAGSGDGRYVESIRQLAAHLKAGDRITFAGNVGSDRKRELFAEADLFVLPSYSENFGIAVVEAMAHGVPVLISTHVGIHREVTEANAGRAAEVSASLFAEEICAMFSDTEALATMGRNGRKLAAERYSPDVVSRQVQAEYKRILEAAAA